MGGILRGIGFLLMGIIALPMMLLSMLIGLFFIGAEKADKAVENQLGEPYAKARDRTVNAIYKAFVAMMVIGFAFFLLTMCMESGGNRDADCDWTSRGQFCSPG